MASADFSQMLQCTLLLQMCSLLAGIPMSVQLYLRMLDATLLGVASSSRINMNTWELLVYNVSH